MKKISVGIAIAMLISFYNNNAAAQTKRATAPFSAAGKKVTVYTTCR